MSAPTTRPARRCRSTGCAGACGASTACTVLSFVSLEERLVGQLQRNGVEADRVAVGIVHPEQYPAHGCAVHAIVVDASLRELRCIGIAIAGDAEPIPLADRPAMAEAMTAPTFDERLRLMASLTASLMERTGPLLDVAFQAAPSEPSIAAAAATGRADTRRTLREFWHRIHDDGLLPPSIDLQWLTESATLIAHAETYLLIGKTTGWDSDTYRDWLATTWHRLAASSRVPPR